MTDWALLDHEYLMSTYSRLPLVIDHAEGNYLFDINEKRYLDLFTGLAVNILGHSHPYLMNALATQAERFLHISNFFYNPPAIRLAKRLVDNTLEDGKVYFCSTGAEATEAAIKSIHKWISRQEEPKEGIIVLKNSFHGRTLGALRLTRQPGIYQDFPTLPISIYEVNMNDIAGLKDICEKHHPAAILVEPILGAGGILPLTQQFLETAQALCQEKNMLFCLDEIQTGVGRTGTLFAYQAYDLKPDLILFAKGIGGGLPLGGIIAGQKLKNTFQPGDHGTTFSPSPLSAALGNAVLDVLIEQHQLEKGKEVADFLWSELQKLQRKFPALIEQINGRGMMIGIITTLSKTSIEQLRQEFLENGILINITAGTIIRLLPPLTLTKEEVTHFIDIFHQLLAKME
ncbi:acetylornithine transaminase [Shimazuella sp. AN120528]|uniref:aspartate aminotransferase family protein n=1 Tax=Shimazuella soli TaxID=1892854 RepID=UPI001F0E411D|nr:acetylornithine transaminase [Shimazuella soli]MCH5585655.1 acetylornithine transaminase [Shimazuella soli]